MAAIQCLFCIIEWVWVHIEALFLDIASFRYIHQFSSEYLIRRTLLELAQHISPHVLSWVVLHLNFTTQYPVRNHEVPVIDVLGSSSAQYALICFEDHGQFVALIELVVLNIIPLCLNKVLAPQQEAQCIICAYNFTFD